MAAKLKPVPDNWRHLDRDQIEALFVTTAHRRARHKQLLRAGNIEDYLFIGGPELPSTVAAERLGLAVHTVEQFRAILRKALSCAG